MRHLGGKQVDVVRELNAPTYSVARWYGKAVQHTAELEELSDASLHALTRASRGERVVKRGPRFRYQVEVG